MENAIVILLLGMLLERWLTVLAAIALAHAKASRE